MVGRRQAAWRSLMSYINHDTPHFRETLNKSFDKALLSKVEGLRTNGK
jgi:hypothetical protein